MLNRVTINSAHDSTMVLFYRALYFRYLRQIIIRQLFRHTFLQQSMGYGKSMLGTDRNVSDISEI